jgi:hypothetical protein
LAEGRAPSLSAFLQTANQANTSEITGDRTLPPRNRQLKVYSVTSRYIVDNVSATRLLWARCHETSPATRASP